MRFMSDNTAPAAPQVMAALVAANDGHARSYGAEAAMDLVRAEIRSIFEAPEAEVHLVATGTAANALALACLTPPWGAVLCHEGAHVNEDECGAPEFYTAGAKLIPLGGPGGRIDPAALAARLAVLGGASVHNVQAAALSLTNATEAGTVYRAGAVAELCGMARSAGLGVHLDGARLANALAFTGEAPADGTWRAAVDVLCLGGTKGGCLGVEAVVFFDPARARDFGFRRKRAGHLMSKHRFLSAQMLAWLRDGLWLELARAANARAAALAEGLAALPDVTPAWPAEANAVFARWPRGLHRAAMAAGAEYYLWDWDATLEGPGEEPLLARLVCNWSTTAEEVEGFLALLRRG